MIDDDVSLKIVEAILGLNDKAGHEELMRWIIDDARRRRLYLHWAKILDEAFPVDPSDIAVGSEPPDVLDAIEDRINSSQAKSTWNG